MLKDKTILVVLTVFLVLSIFLNFYFVYLIANQNEAIISNYQNNIGEEETDTYQQSAPVAEDEIPEEAIRINISKDGFDPQSFEANASEKITLAVSSTDNSVHIFKFRDESLQDAAVGVYAGETCLISFYTPSEPGEYEYYCGMLGHYETGKMIIK